MSVFIALCIVTTALFAVVGWYSYKPLVQQVGERELKLLAATRLTIINPQEDL
jgi:hypothetical protein